MLFSYFGIAQQTVQKNHYRIINDGFDYTLQYEKALAHTQLDNLRYIDSRRQIPIEGTKIIIELFSAQELFESYGKPISPLTATKSVVKEPIKFKLAPNKYYLYTTNNSAEEQQTSANMKMARKETINNFGGTLFDSGGMADNYGNNETYVKTIYSDNGESPYLEFSFFAIENNFDFMYVYDGPSVTSKLIGAYTGGTNPKIVQASGAYLTVVFTSDGSNTERGWSALVGRGTPHPPPSPMGVADSCSSAAPFCATTAGTGGITFPASTDGTNTAGSGPSAQTGPSYGCLGSTPNPAWYYLQVANSGNLVMTIAGSGGYDVDFICWGPFTSQTAPCGSSLTGGCGFGTPTLTTNSPCSGNIVDCSYSTSATETCTISNGVAGQYYLILITNFYDMPQNINLNQTSGSGNTNCNIVNCGVTATNTGPYCVGQTVTLNAATTNTTATTYAWTGPNGYNAAGQNVTIPNATAATAGVYSVTGTTGGTVTCVATTTVVVNSSIPPTVTSATVCAGGTGTLKASPAGSYTWNTGVVSDSLSDNPAATTVYTLTAGAGTCTSSATGTITVVSNPSITVNSGMICTGNSIQLTASGATTYTWSPDPTLSGITGANATASPTATTNYTVSGSVGTCTATPVTSTVTVVSAVVPTVSSNTPCANQTLNLSCNAGYTNYLWGGPNGFTSTAQNPTKAGVAVTASGVYSVGVTDANGCINTASLNVVVNPLPVVTGTASTACIGFPVNLTATPGFVTYSWSGLAGFTAPGQTATIANAALSNQGLYVVTVVDGNGCTNANTNPIQVIVYSPPTVKVNDTTVCMLSSGSLVASGALTYNWNPLGDLNTNVGNIVVATPTIAGTTIYTVTGTDVNGCINTAVATVKSNLLPILDVQPALTKGCTPQCANYTVTSSSGATAYNWNFGNMQTSTAASPVACFTLTGNYTVKVTLTDINHCKNTATANVVAYPIPVADFNYTPDPVGILEPTVTFLNSSMGNIIHYSWNFGDSLSTKDTSNLNTPKYTYQNVGSYPVSLVVVSANGCSDTIVRTLVVEQDFALFVPNSFTPNGDGKNEVFKAEGEGILDFKMYIYDRWGNNVFTTTDINIGWDGRLHNKVGGDALQTDVYVWKIDLKNTVHQGKTYTGTVTLLK